MTDKPDSVRECIRVTPTTEAPDPEGVSKYLSGFHSLSPGRDDEQGMLARLASSVVSDGSVRIECLVISEGEGEPVEVYYTADEQLSALEQGLKNLYPSSFEIERTTIDLRRKLIRPVEFDPDGFVQQLKAEMLNTSVEELAASNQPTDDQTDTATDDKSSLSTETESIEPVSQESGDESLLPVTKDAATQSLPVPQKNGTLDPKSGYGLIDDTIIQIRTCDDVPTDEPLTALEQPAAISNDRILARPAASAVEPYAVRWKGKEERSGDWMTAAKTSTAVPDEYNSWRRNQQDSFEPEPLVSVMERAAEASAPTAFQVVAEPKPNWEGQADRRIENLNDGRDQTFRKVLGTERGHALESEQERIQLIKAKHSKRSFDVNVRLLSIHTPHSVGGDTLPDARTIYTDPDAISRFHDDMETLLNPIDGEFYWFVGKRANRSSGRLSTQSEAEAVWQRFQERELVTRSQEGMAKSMNPVARTHPELILSPVTLADLLILPSAHQFSGDLFRSTGAHHQDRSPLPAPNPRAIEQFYEGATVGYPIDEDGEPYPQPVALPKRLLRQHFGVFAGSGAGKSIKIANLLLSLHDDIPGPEILFEPKGDQMCEDYLRAYYAKYGDLEDVYLFDVPEQLPSVAFFDIRPALSAGRDRSEAIQDRINHFHSIMEVIMGEETYNTAYLAKQIISYLIRAEFDAEYGSDAFSVDNLYQAAESLYRDQSVPRASQDVEETLSRLLEKPERDFDKTMSAVFTRLDKLRENEHIYEMLNQTPEWDSQRERYAEECLSFREISDRDVQLLFDTGALRPETQQAFTLILLSTLWDDMQWRRRQNAGTGTSQVNLIIEEAAGIVSKPLVYEQLIPQARSFELSLGFVMQFPSQVRDAGGERAYNEIMNNVQNKIYGKIEKPDDYLESSIAVDEVVPEQVANKLKHMRPGEWIVDLSARFGDDVTTPFSIEALPIPEGHPEGSDPLESTPEFERAYQRCVSQTSASFTTTSDDAIGDITPHSDAGSSDHVSSSVRESTPTGARSPVSGDDAAEAGTSNSGIGVEPSASSGINSNSGSGSGADESQTESNASDRSPSVGRCQDCGDYTQPGVELCDDCRNSSTGATDETASTSTSTVSDTMNDAGERGDTVDGCSVGGSGDVHVEDVPMDGGEVDVDAASIETMTDVRRVAMAVSQHHSGFTKDVKYGVIEQHANIAGLDTSQSEIKEIGEDVGQSLESDEGNNLNTSTDAGQNSDPEVEASPVAVSTDDSDVQSSQTETVTLSESSDQDAPQQLAVPMDNGRVNVEAAHLESVSDAKRVAKAIHTSPSDQSETLRSLRQLHSRAIGVGIDVSFPDLEQVGTDTADDDPQSGSAESDPDYATQAERVPETDDASIIADPEAGDTETVFEQVPGAHASVQARDREELGLTQDDVDFLGLLAKAYHGELDEYSLLESMTSLRDRAGDPDIDRLTELDLVERASSRRAYYTLLPDGWDLIGRTQHNAGDWNEKIIHRVGVEIAGRHIRQRNAVADVEPYYQHDQETVFDLVGLDESGAVVCAAEVECFHWNQEAIIDDYQKLANIDADAIWYADKTKTAKRILTALRKEGIADSELNWNGEPQEELQVMVQNADLAGLHNLWTFSKIRTVIEE